MMKTTKKQRQRIVAKLCRQHRYCKHCENFKPASAHHCRQCKRCVHKMDHHCPWVKNCVGQNNLKYFIQYLVYVFIACAMATGQFIYRFVLYMRDETPERQLSKEELVDDTIMICCCVFSCVVSMLFCAFIVALMSDVYEALITGVPGIDAMQGVPSLKHRKLADAILQDVFENTPFSYKWLLPIPNETGKWTIKESK
mmetsp:Transcript_8990/g.11713  ORF Transcript_8990/g.11713 Transcript_8990/m.11713 type:complete len:198 (-) Transcript_8990:1561-2154(-)